VGQQEIVRKSPCDLIAGDALGQFPLGDTLGQFPLGDDLGQFPLNLHLPML